MYGYLSKTKQSLALKLMAIYTLKSNILVHFFPPILLTRFIPFQIAILPLLRNCAKFLPFYSPKFSIQIRYTFSLRFALNSFSARHQNCYLKRDFSRYLFGYTNLLALDIAPIAQSYHIFGHIKFTYLLRKVT